MKFMAKSERKAPRVNKRIGEHVTTIKKQVLIDVCCSPELIR